MNSHQQALTPSTGVGVASLPTGIAGHVHMGPSPGPGASSTNHVNPTSNNANHGNGVSIGNGKQGSSGSASSTGALSGNTMAGRKRGNSGDKKNGPPPTCLGCGATETPEWRRGPMGPRTLCNACVSPILLTIPTYGSFPAFLRDTSSIMSWFTITFPRGKGVSNIHERVG